MKPRTAPKRPADVIVYASHKLMVAKNGLRVKKYRIFNTLHRRNTRTNTSHNQKLDV